MSDLPAQGLFQQLNARPVSGEHLEVLGKKAAALWSTGSTPSLNEAVVETVKHAGLSPEQVRRVIEFANTDAYLTEFKKEGSHRVVSFSGGPANPSDILKDLNDGGGGSVFDRGTSDYKQPPRVKTASVDGAEEAFEHAFLEKNASIEYPEVNPLGDVLELKDKLAASYDSMTYDISSLESSYSDLADRVYGGMKQAALSGRTLGEIVQVWSAAVPSPEHIKVAFKLFTPRLLREGVFASSQELSSSIEKIGQARIPNPNHPMITDFQEYCDTLSKLAELRAAREDVKEGLGQLISFLKQSNAAVPSALGLAGKITGAARGAAAPVGKAGRVVAEKLVGPGEAANMVGSALETATKYSPHAAAVVGANEVRRHLKYSPTWNRFQAVANPQSDQYRQREYEIASRAQYGGGQYQ